MTCLRRRDEMRLGQLNRAPGPAPAGSVGALAGLAQIPISLVAPVSPNSRSTIDIVESTL
jgi:hypothetical protein